MTSRIGLCPTGPFWGAAKPTTDWWQIVISKYETYILFSHQNVIHKALSFHFSQIDFCFISRFWYLNRIHLHVYGSMRHYPNNIIRQLNTAIPYDQTLVDSIH